jgi:hypothetical protein
MNALAPCVDFIGGPFTETEVMAVERDATSPAMARHAHFQIGEAVVNVDAQPHLRDIAKALEDLLRLPAGWDSYGSRRVSTDAALAAFVLLHGSVSDNTPLPEFVPTPEGGVQLEWHTDEVEIEVHCRPGWTYHLYICDSAGDELEVDLLRDDLSPAVNAIARLSDRGERNMDGPGLRGRSRHPG